MADRLTSLDTSFLHLEEGNTPMHVGSVMVFEPPAGGFGYDQFVALVKDRLDLVPRYRQRVREVPGRLANPVWVDDPGFDLSYHVRRSALPRPGTDEQLEEFVARIAPRPLDRKRPLWEAYVVEGLDHGRFALVTKTHPALVDGVSAVDLAHVILTHDPDEDARTDRPVGDGWRAAPEPSSAELVTAALVDAVRRPTRIVETVGHGIADVASTTRRVAGSVTEVASTLLRASARPAPTSPLNTHVGTARRFVMVGTDLEDYRRARSHLLKGRFAEDVTVNDVILATLAGAFRTWLLTRGESVTTGTTVRALVPVSVYAEGDTASAPGLKACFVDLPVGEPGPSMRLHQIAFAMRQQVEAGQAVDAATLAGLGGFAPPNLQALGARLGSAVSRRLYNVAVTNVPGPQTPLYAAGARLLSTYPVMPLGREQAFAVGLTSYDGGVYYGLNADRDAVPDADVFGEGIVDALAELLAGPRRAPR